VSAVIYAAIVVMWAIVLVPMWLRRHDAATESRSVDKFSTAMRTLSRRTHGTPGRRYVVMPRREAGALSVHVSGAAVPSRPAARPAQRPQRPDNTLVARRRRVLLALLSLVFLTFILAVAGVLPWLLQLVIDLALAAFVAHLRAQARRAAVVSRQRRRAAAAPVPTARPARFAPAATAPTARAGPAAIAVESTADGTAVEVTWDPVPVPPPTYTLKPPAPAATAAYADPAPPAPAHVDDVADEVPTELDEILERRWAVND
jgi:hypothetical protein